MTTSMLPGRQKLSAGFFRHRRTDDGLPLSSFSDLIAHLATQTMTVIAVPGAKDAAFTTLTNPTALQNAAFRLLETEHARVQ